MNNNICKQCKLCCVGKGTLHLSEREFDVVKEKLYNKIKHFIQKDDMILIPFQNGRCVFNNGEGCILNDIDRPITCKMYPFKIINNEWVLRTNCPYWYKFDEKHFESVINEFDKYRYDWKD